MDRKTALTLHAPLALLLLPLAFGCGTDTGDDDDATQTPGATWDTSDAITYRDDLSSHPGCSTAGLTYTPATIADYQCAAKEYAFPQGVTEDTSKPILLLVHGNSDTPASWEAYPAGDDNAIDQLSERAVAAGFKTIAIDMRIDLVDDPQGNNDTENAARNVDHGWSTPLVQHFIKSVMAANPSRKVSVVGFSLGTTVVRDAYRRMYLDGDNPFARTEDLMLLAGANHGVSTYYLCGTNPTMRGQVACEMGDRTNYSPTAFLNPLNGPERSYESPCVDGDTAYGDTGACGGNAVGYTTIVMQDISDGTYQDLFVSEDSASLLGSDNRLLSLNDVDESGYFFGGLFANHYGSARSEAALQIIMSRLTD